MFFDLGQHSGILYQPASGHCRDDLAREIVLGRADAAAGDDDIGAIQRAGNDLLHSRRIVADNRFKIEIDAERGQTLRHPRRIRVDDLSQQQLRPDRNDFRRSHRTSPGSRRIYTLARTRHKTAPAPTVSCPFPASLPEYAHDSPALQ